MIVMVRHDTRNGSMLFSSIILKGIDLHFLSNTIPPKVRVV